ncbi:hypothetical protein VOLCADRAFT_98656 [Volvox carteri f. nagariensis]|uniref:Uncharacterized protein n=1 Tax=Volvox carteri f. nagariensis TaxID=3068 RepID=D8UFY0_VOLCA|nr:uncharacterized protein VOLCADRAFT_98656 [Volvox carteri f. nagariensis]EFJ41358.1 hypothetical protein VOLCADRAFT_98656 [Volvox carteri f. nagariensis]|eukprot:XP_002957588.1 hypothetical protein VOLCADRAFT_98656 [Volvox carteri f. nagariensis]
MKKQQQLLHRDRAGDRGSQLVSELAHTTSGVVRCNALAHAVWRGAVQRGAVRCGADTEAVHGVARGCIARAQAWSGAVRDDTFHSRKLKRYAWTPSRWLSLHATQGTGTGVMFHAQRTPPHPAVPVQ